MSIWRRMKLLFFRFFTLTACAIAALAQQTFVSKDLQNADPNANVNVIVRYRQPPAGTNRSMAAGPGGMKKTELPSIQGVAYSIPAGSVQNLAADPNVLSIVADRKVRMLLDNSAAAVNASAAWNLGLDGTGIGVAIIDSGISEHDDLKGSGGSRIVYRESFIASDTNDNFGHGEHVAGIVGGNGTDSRCGQCNRNFIGIAP